MVGNNIDKLHHKRKIAGKRILSCAKCKRQPRLELFENKSYIHCFCGINTKPHKEVLDALLEWNSYKFRTKIRESNDLKEES